MKDLSLSVKYGRNNLIAKVPMSTNRVLLLNIQNDMEKYLNDFYNFASWL